jgi:signal transduction histidine kinase
MIITFILVTRRQKLNQKLMLELKLANESKERLISIIGHDLRGSVGALRSAAKAISEGMTDLNEAKNLLESFYPVAETTYDLLENLLTWTKCNKEKIAPAFEEINLQQLAEKSIEHTRHLASAKSVTTFNKIDEIKLSADKNMILSVLRNMLTNAIKFSHQKSEVVLSSRIENDNVIVSIHDDGIGIEADVLEELLKNPEDFQSPGTLGERGSGLGISICKTFLESHNGAIWAESSFGEGTTFYFSLPLHRK